MNENMKKTAPFNDLVDIAMQFHEDWRGNGENHEPLEKIGQCWCCDAIDRAVKSHEALLTFAKKHHDFCDDCEGTGKVYNNADPTSGQWVPCPYAKAIAQAENVGFK